MSDVRRQLQGIEVDVDGVACEDANLRRGPKSDLEAVREELAHLRGQLAMLTRIFDALPWALRWLLRRFVAATSERIQAQLHALHCKGAAVRQPSELHDLPDRRQAY